ncbi:complex I assembly factor TIMMDC1, mitochondrial-like [Ptychodera flava]|uniref:complex I assembly factor TIMMDC1, mitochondrial-like n=1 Tax=Ptychodera flava TaxID=63121 RepID=UPI00396A074E
MTTLKLEEANDVKAASDSDQLGESGGGWNAVKRLFRSRELGLLSEEMGYVFRYSAGAFVLGFVYGGFPASHLSRGRYIEKSHATTYEHRVEAVRQSHNAGMRGFIRYGWRWGWRVAVLTGMFQGFNLVLATYRNKVDTLNYVTAAGVAGALYKIQLGPKGVFAGGVIGSLLGIPVGLSLVSLQYIAGENILEQFRREERERMAMRKEELNKGKEYMELALDLAEKEMAESKTLLEKSQKSANS